MQWPDVQSPKSHRHAQWEGKKKEGKRERKLVQTPEKKMFRNPHNETIVKFSPLVLVVSLENAIKIF